MKDVEGDDSGPSARETLLDAVMAQAHGRGIDSQSLRRLGESVGSSHRMLIYHFGTRQGLIDAVAARMAEQQRQVETLRLDRGPGRHDSTGLGVGRTASPELRWTDFDDLELQGPLLFELWVRAMIGAPGSEQVRADAAVASITAITGSWSAAGCSPTLARDLAALQLALGRGLLLDLLLGGTKADVAACADRLGSVLTGRRSFEAMEQLMPLVGERARTAAGQRSGQRSIRQPDGPTGGEAAPMVGAREQLLELMMDHLSTSSLGGRSLRQLAAALGTSHRMLIYHFGSRTGLVEEVVGRIQRYQQQDLIRLAGTEPSSEASGWFWNSVLDRLDAHGPLIFELALLGIQHRHDSERIRSVVIDGYLGPFTDLWQAAGHSVSEAAELARLQIAVVRGLMIDYLLTGSEQNFHRVIALVSLLLARRSPW